jgi:hypothetical protein
MEEGVLAGRLGMEPGKLKQPLKFIHNQATKTGSHL